VARCIDLPVPYAAKDTALASDVIPPKLPSLPVAPPDRKTVLFTSRTRFFAACLDRIFRRSALATFAFFMATSLGYLSPTLFQKILRHIAVNVKQKNSKKMKISNKKTNN
jgi:hypothetical protein